MCALMPRTEGLPGLEDTGIDAFLRRYRSECPRIMWVGLVVGSLVFALTPLITIGVPLPSFLLPRRALDRHASKIASHRVYVLRQAVFLVKMVAGLCWGSHADVRKILALPPYPPDPGTWRSS
jgi:hypothetical protein